MYQVDNEDANFLFLEKAESPTHISLIYLYDQSSLGAEPVRFKHIREHISNRLNAAPVFYQKIQRTPADIDYPYWVDDERFDLDFHVRHLALPKPGDWRQFCIQVSRLHSRALDMSRPLWELYVIEGLDNVEGFPADSFAIYFKVHHCAMDEFTAQELLQSLHARKPDRRQHETTGQHIAHLPSSAPPKLEMVLRGLFNNSVRSLRLLFQSASNIRTISKIATRMSIRAAQSAVEKTTPDGRGNRFQQPLTQSRVFEGNFFPRRIFDDYLEIVQDATLTHAFLCICGEAMRLYLERHGELGEDSLQALLEVNVRNAGAHALIGNSIAINQIELHSTVIYPEGRLQAIVASNRELHTIEGAELTSIKLRSLYENLPAPLLAWLGRNSNKQNSLNRRIMEGGNLGLAELSGSGEKRYLLGAELKGFSSISPLYSGCGLMFAASTYCDSIGITFTSDRNMMPDPEIMRECLDEAVSKLQSYLASKKQRPKSARAKRKPKAKSRSPQSGPHKVATAKGGKSAAA
jgi:WS/DGAT/MGAT family acyltransferase